MSRPQPDWEATRAIVQARLVAALAEFVAGAPDDRSMTAETDGHVVVRHSGRTWRWWVDPEPAVNPTGETGAPRWQLEIWVHDEPAHPTSLADRVRSAVSPHSHAAGTIRAGDDDPAGRVQAIVRSELERQVRR